jgi:hypothetical protein
MKIIGTRKSIINRGFSEELNQFLKLCIRLRKNETYIPRGIYRFKTFDEANEWNMKMLLGKKPEQDLRH